MPDPIISLINVSKHYPLAAKAGVSEINLSIDKGEFIAIIGESGSGKSTLLKLIYGLLGPEEGEVFFKEEKVLGPAEKLIPGHPKMKMVTQDFNLNIYARVYDNISAMLSNEDVQSKKLKTLEMMEFLGIDKLAEKKIVELSGGEQQRVALARAIITEPEVLLLDEPFSQVDAILKNQLRADLKRLSHFLGITIILVSHDPQDGLSLADKLVLIREGHIIQQGTPALVAARPVSSYVGQLIGNANIISGEEAYILLDLPAMDSPKVLIYPHQIKVSDAGIPARVKQCSFKLIYDELELELGEIVLHGYAEAGRYKTGDELKITIENYTLLDS